MLQECVVYLCGTKVDLVEENKKARKVDVHVVREYSDGKAVISPPASLLACVYYITEINAKYMETSAKTGYNIGEPLGCVEITYMLDVPTPLQRQCL